MSFLANAMSKLAAISDDEVCAIARRIDGDGIYCMSSFLLDEDLRRLREFVALALASGGNQTISLNRDALAGSGLDDLANLAAFKSLFSRLYSFGCGRPAPEIKFHQILRCLTGETASEHSFLFHYDSYAITALIPIEIPTVGQRGDFLIIPNTRGIRSNYVLNLIDKAIIDNHLTQRFLKSRMQKIGAVKRVALVPGSLYFFWGYRSIHTNEPVDKGEVRATALFHYADPHENSYLKRRLGRI